jgi:hypothetical protein
MIAADAELTVEDGGIFQIKAVYDGGAGVDEYVYYEFDMTNDSTTTYPYVTFRYKTSESAAGAKIKIVLVYTVGDQTILDQVYSTSWVTTTVDLTAAKTFDKIQIYADDDGTDGTFYVYLDWLILHKSTFTIEDWDSLNWVMRKKMPSLDMPGKDGDNQQNLGIGEMALRMSGSMKQGQTWGTPMGQHLLSAFRDDSFSYFTSDLYNGPVIFSMFDLGQDKNVGQQRGYTLELTPFTKANLKSTLYADKEWYGK